MEFKAERVRRSQRQWQLHGLEMIFTRGSLHFPHWKASHKNAELCPEWLDLFQMSPQLIPRLKKRPSTLNETVWQQASRIQNKSETTVQYRPGSVHLKQRKDAGSCLGRQEMIPAIRAPDPLKQHGKHLEWELLHALLESMRLGVSASFYTEDHVSPLSHSRLT